MARVLSTAVPIDPPICIEVLAVAAATPTSGRSTPVVAMLMAGVKTQPMPAPSNSSAGSSKVR